MIQRKLILLNCNKYNAKYLFWLSNSIQKIMFIQVASLDTLYGFFILLYKKMVNLGPLELQRAPKLHPRIDQAVQNNIILIFWRSPSSRLLK